MKKIAPADMPHLFTAPLFAQKKRLPNNGGLPGKLFLVLIILLATGCRVFKSNSESPAFSKNPVVAHRGAFKKNGFPENSLASLREAIRLGCTGSEFDVRMTSDDSLVINHDPKHHSLQIEKATYAQLTAFPLSNGEPLPTLRSYLLAGLRDNKHTRLVVEIKPSDIGKDRGRAVAAKVLALVNELGADKMAVYISFDYDILKEIVRLNPKAGTQYLNGDQPPSQLKADGITGADYHMSVFRKNPQWIEEAKAAKIILNAWTVNEEADMKWLLTSGFDFITTNEPELLLTLQPPPAM